MNGKQGDGKEVKRRRIKTYAYAEGDEKFSDIFFLSVRNPTKLCFPHLFAGEGQIRRGGCHDSKPWMVPKQQAKESSNPAPQVLNSAVHPTEIIYVSRLARKRILGWVIVD